MSTPDTSAAALRQAFLGFFESHGHAVVKSAPLIPQNDPTLMFVNAGMVQFKDLFVGHETRSYTRATTSQKCMRVSGKHNDLEEVGRTARHQTLFEMLGNFSFGDYFKEEAITLAWRFLTEEMKLDQSKLWVTVFGGNGDNLPADTEARELWKRISGLPDERIIDMGMKDNFWAMGDTGPCGPCTEIHYDTGGDTPPVLEDFETGRVVEIWNNVFMQFNRLPSGELQPLPSPSVDTGMGLERLTTIMQGETSNYHTDLFLPLLAKTSELAGKTYQRSDSEDDVSMRVIADHARATAFLVAEGVQPSNEGRGYVMRRIMRRAIRHGHRLGLQTLFFHQVCDVVIDIMGDAYPELPEARELISKVAELEETNFRRTLSNGLRILEESITQLRETQQSELSGESVFKLYDTYGFPKDLTEVIAQEQGLTIDEAGFKEAMQAQQERSRGGDVGSAAIATIYKELAQSLDAIEFIGYPHEDSPIEERSGSWRTRQSGAATYLEAQCQIVALLSEGQPVEEASEGILEVILNPTPFYGESGGQAGDKGIIVQDQGLQLEVLNSTKPVEGLTMCQVRVLSGVARKDATVWAGYQPNLRKETRAHHSATHLLHLGLREVLGNHVKQAGSLVDPNHLRFDYSHFEAPTDEHLSTVEASVNARIQSDAAVSTDVLPFEEARAKGAMALFGEKYGDIVRVVNMGDSVEFCGGTHVRQTSDIGMILITKEEAIASGVRRLEAECGVAARTRTTEIHGRLDQAAGLLKGDLHQIDAEQEPVLAAIAKATRTYRELIQTLEDLGAEAQTVSITPSAPTLPEDFGADAARRGRDLWRALTKAVNSKASEIEDLAARYTELDAGGLLGGLAQLQLTNRANERTLTRQKQAEMGTQAGVLLEEATTVGGISLLATRVEGVDGKGLRELADQLRSQLPSGILCLGAESEGRASLLIAVTKDLTASFQAGKLIKDLAPIIGGRGGGKSELAQGGGTDPAKLEELFSALKTTIQAQQ